MEAASLEVASPLTPVARVLAVAASTEDSITRDNPTRERQLTMKRIAMLKASKKLGAAAILGRTGATSRQLGGTRPQRHETDG